MLKINVTDLQDTSSSEAEKAAQTLPNQDLDKVKGGAYPDCVLLMTGLV